MISGGEDVTLRTGLRSTIQSFWIYSVPDVTLFMLKDGKR